jgi:hypothetical protein
MCSISHVMQNCKPASPLSKARSKAGPKSTCFQICFSRSGDFAESGRPARTVLPAGIPRFHSTVRILTVGFLAFSTGISIRFRPKTPAIPYFPPNSTSKIPMACLRNLTLPKKATAGPLPLPLRSIATSLHRYVARFIGFLVLGISLVLAF